MRQYRYMMKNELLTSKTALKELFKIQYKAILIMAYILYENNGFCEEELRDFFNEKYKFMFPKKEIKRDIKNQIRERISKHKRTTEIWYEEMKESIKYKESEFTQYKLTSEGKKIAKDLIKKITNDLKEIKFDNLDSENMSGDNSLTIKEIVENIKSGTVAKIPTFQREYVWKTKKIAPLLFSLIKNYPIGSMLIWKPEKNSENYILLDGLQRTFSLVRISERPFAYINYEMYIWFKEKYFKDSEKISETNFNEFNKNWLNYEDDEDNFIKEKMIESFENDIQIIRLLEFLEKKWDILYNKMKIPILQMNHTFKRDDSADVFNLINSQGVELNNYEKNSSIWSKTPIEIKSVLKESHFIMKWKSNKEIEYREKINVIGKNILEEPKSTNEHGDKDNDEKCTFIEPSDFIYSVFQSAIDSSKSVIVKHSFFRNDKIKTEALEPVVTIFMNILKLSYPKDMSKLGSVLNDKIKTKKDIKYILDLIKNSIKFVEDSLRLISNISTNSKDAVKIKLASSLMSFLINIKINMDDEDSNLSHDDILHIFIYEFFSNNYSSGSTATAWKNYKSAEKYYRKINKKDAEKAIVKYIDKNFKKNEKIDKTFDDKRVLISSLFRSRFVIGEKNDSYQIDHIIPKSLFNFVNSKSSKAISNNFVNSIYNLQLLPSKINNEKDNKINGDVEKYYIINKMSSAFNDHELYKEQFKNHMNILFEKMCKQTNNLEKGKNFICKKHTIKEESFYNEFNTFINFQKNYIRKLILKNGLLSDEEIIKI